MKFRKAAVCGLACFLTVFFLLQPCFAEPLGVDIKTNGEDGYVVVTPGDTVSIAVGLVAGDKAGESANWWVAVKTPFDPPVLVQLCASGGVDTGHQQVRPSRAI